MYDSDSEMEYTPDLDDLTQYDYRSNNSSKSDSDEEYTCSYTAKTKRTKTSSTAIGKGFAHRKPRAAPKIDLHRVPPEFTASSNEEHGFMPVYNAPPLLVKDNKTLEIGSYNPSDVTQSSIPALIKTSIITSQAPTIKTETTGFDLTAAPGTKQQFVKKKERHAAAVSRPHIQPPPGLVQPQAASRTTTPVGTSPGLRFSQPPPLVKSKDDDQLSSSKVVHPHIVLPTSAQQDWNSPSFVTISGRHSITPPPPTPPHLQHTAPHALTAHTSLSASSTGGFSSARTDPPDIERMSRGHKKKKRTEAAAASSSTSDAKVHFRPSKSTKGQTASYQMKGMKVTRYEFQSRVPSQQQQQQQQRPPAAAATVTSSPPSHPHQYQQRPPTAAATVTSSPPSHPHQYPIASSNSPPVGIPVQGVQNLMTPLQLFQPGSHQVTYQNLPGVPTAATAGGMFLVPGGSSMHPGVAVGHELQQSYITQGGQTYQILQPTAVAGGGDPNSNENAQKVSVIMSPQTGAPTFITASDFAGYQFIPQLDGTSGSARGGAAKTKEKQPKKLRESFEEVKREEQEKFQSLAREVSVDSGGKKSTEETTSCDSELPDDNMETGPPLDTQCRDSQRNENEKSTTTESRSDTGMELARDSIKTRGSVGIVVKKKPFDSSPKQRKPRVRKPNSKINTALSLMLATKKQAKEAAKSTYASWFPAASPFTGGQLGQSSSAPHKLEGSTSAVPKTAAKRNSSSQLDNLFLPLDVKYTLSAATKQTLTQFPNTSPLNANNNHSAGDTKTNTTGKSGKTTEQGVNGDGDTNATTDLQRSASVQSSSGSSEETSAGIERDAIEPPPAKRRKGQPKQLIPSGGASPSLQKTPAKKNAKATLDVAAAAAQLPTTSGEISNPLVPPAEISSPLVPPAEISSPLVPPAELIPVAPFLLEQSGPKLLAQFLVEIPQSPPPVKKLRGRPRKSTPHAIMPSPGETPSPGRPTKTKKSPGSQESPLPWESPSPGQPTTKKKNKPGTKKGASASAAGSWQCPLCSESYGSRLGLRMHTDKEHSAISVSYGLVHVQHPASSGDLYPTRLSAFITPHRKEL